MNVRDLAERVAGLAVGETLLLPSRDLNQAEWESTDELERELRSAPGGGEWAFRWTADGLWVTRRDAQRP
jgi:hypothetical protein